MTNCKSFSNLILSFVQSKGVKKVLFLLFFCFLSHMTFAQGIADGVFDFNKLMEKVALEIQQSTGNLFGVSKNIAGIAAFFYIGNRVWKHIAEAEAIDLYPLFKPFVIGILVMNFQWVTGFIDLVVSPVIIHTNNLQSRSNESINLLLEAKQKAMEDGKFWNMYVGDAGQGDRDLWYDYSNPDSAGEEGWLESVGNGIQFALEKASFHLQMNIKTWMSEILQVLYQAAGLAINTIRLFYLLILGFLGPLSFALSVFNGFHQTLTQWIARYVNVYLWLPVANIFGLLISEIQKAMLDVDLQQIENSGKTFFSSTDTAFLIFMVIAIIGYTTVPSVANYIIYAGGKDSLLHKTSNYLSSASSRGLGMLR